MILGILFILAFLGLSASLAVHACAFLGFHAQQLSPFIGLLFVLLFPVWILTVCLVKKDETNGEDAAEIAPKWIKVMTVSFFAYALLSFLLISGLRIGVPDTLNGRKALVSHGSIVAYLTDQEYETELIHDVRVHSAAIMMFYSFAVMFLCAKLKQKAIKSFDEDDYSR